jgi:hypothetical protein
MGKEMTPFSNDTVADIQKYGLEIESRVTDHPIQGRYRDPVLSKKRTLPPQRGGRKEFLQFSILHTSPPASASEIATPSRWCVIFTRIESATVENGGRKK